MNVQINIDEIEKAVLELFNELRNQKGNIIEIEPVDFYWSINSNELYNPYENPTELTLGLISDDLEEMKNIANKKTEPVSYDFVKLSSILTMIGNKTTW
jgi:hypothetical protein